MDEKQLLKEFNKKLLFESLIVSGILGVSVALATGILTAMIFFFVTNAVGAPNVFLRIGIPIAFALLPLISIPMAILFLRRIFKLSTKAVAKRVDSMGMEQRVVTAIEYKNSDSFIARKLREDTEARVAKINVKDMKFVFPKWPFLILAASVVAVVAVFTAQGVISTLAANRLTPPENFRYEPNSHIEWEIPERSEAGFSIRVENATGSVIYSNPNLMTPLLDVSHTVLNIETGFPRFPIGNYRLFVSTNAPATGRLTPSPDSEPFNFTIFPRIVFDSNNGHPSQTRVIQDRPLLAFTASLIPDQPSDADIEAQRASATTMSPLVLNNVTMSFFGWTIAGNTRGGVLTADQIVNEIHRNNTEFAAVWREDVTEIIFSFGNSPVFEPISRRMLATDFRVRYVPTTVTPVVADGGGGPPVTYALVPGELMAFGMLWQGWALHTAPFVPLTAAEIVTYVQQSQVDRRQPVVTFVGVWWGAADVIDAWLEDLRIMVRENAEYDEDTNPRPISYALRDSLLNDIDNFRDTVVQGMQGQLNLVTTLTETRERLERFAEELTEFIDEILALRRDIDTVNIIPSPRGSIDFGEGPVLPQPPGPAGEISREGWHALFTALEHDLAAQTTASIAEKLAQVRGLAHTFGVYLEEFTPVPFRFFFNNENSARWVSANTAQVHTTAPVQTPRFLDDLMDILSGEIFASTPAGELIFFEDAFRWSLLALLEELEWGLIDWSLPEDAPVPQPSQMASLNFHIDNNSESLRLFLSAYFFAEFEEWEPFEDIDGIRGLFGITGWYSLILGEDVVMDVETLLLYIALANPHGDYPGGIMQFGAIYGWFPLDEFGEGDEPDPDFPMDVPDIDEFPEDPEDPDLEIDGPTVETPPRPGDPIFDGQTEFADWWWNQGGRAAWEAQLRPGMPQADREVIENVIRQNDTTYPNPNPNP